jgi:casein kinase 1 epsilon
MPKSKSKADRPKFTVPKTVNSSRYVLLERLGNGTFGELYACVDSKTRAHFAVKLERLDCKLPQLNYEYKLYKMLFNHVNVPRVHFFGQEGMFNVMVMDLMGKSLAELFDANGRKFSLKTVLMLSDQLLCRLQELHSKGILHRDLKPNNIVIGNTNETLGTAFLIDYGLAKIYKTSKGHVKYKERRKLTGTARYAALNAHLGKEQGRRDDLESLGFVLIYMLVGRLPWQGNHNAKTKAEMYSRIKSMKSRMTISELCANVPKEFATYLHYVRSLSFTAQPDYDFLRGLFASLFKRKKFEYDGRYDWTSSYKPLYIQPNSGEHKPHKMFSPPAPSAAHTAHTHGDDSSESSDSLGISTLARHSHRSVRPGNIASISRNSPTSSKKRELHKKPHPSASIAEQHNSKTSNRRGSLQLASVAIESRLFGGSFVKAKRITRSPGKKKGSPTHNNNHYVSSNSRRPVSQQLRSRPVPVRRAVEAKPHYSSSAANHSERNGEDTHYHHHEATSDGVSPSLLSHTSGPMAHAKSASSLRHTTTTSSSALHCTAAPGSPSWASHRAWTATHTTSTSSSSSAP